MPGRAMPILYQSRIRKSKARDLASCLRGQERVKESTREREHAPIRVPCDPEPHDPLVGKDRPKEVKDEKEIGDRPGDEAVEFGRSTARLGWRWWREGSQGRCWGCGRGYPGVVFFAPASSWRSEERRVGKECRSRW